MEIDALRWFQLVADGVTVTEVSDLEGVSQSGVSRALARLEAEVGTPLLRRSGRTLRMTHAGAAFKRHVDALVHELDDGLAAVEQLVDPETGTVTVAYQPSLGAWLVPDLVKSFRQKHPQVRFDLRAKRDELVTTVGARAEVDLELSTSRPSGPGYGWRHLTQEPLRVAVPAGHTLAARSEVALAELSGMPLVALRRTSLLRHQCDELFARAGVQLQGAFECDDLPTLRGLVAAGLGLAVVPAPRVLESGASDGRMHLLAVSDAGAAREVGMAWSTERRLLPAADLFRRHVAARAASGSLPEVLTSSRRGSR